MASFVYGSGITYGQYLQADSFVRDITGQIKKSGETTQHKISSQTIEIVASNERLSQEFGAGFDAVNGTIEIGFNRVESALCDVEASIESLHSDFNYNMGLVLDQLQIQNQLTFGILEKLDAIHKTLETPRLTQARECYNIGCERLSKGLLDKALEAFLKAEERNDTDFFTQFQIGKLYLYGVDEDDNVIDLAKAEHHLRNAARYGKAEVPNLPEFRKWTGEALLHASIAYYAQANDHQVSGNTAKAKEFISQAFKHAQQACEIYPHLSESQYHFAKYAALIGDTETSIQSLEKAVAADVNYCMKADFDQDFDNIRPQVFDLFENLRAKIKKQELKRLEEFTQHYITDTFYLTDEAKKDEENIRNILLSSFKNIKKNTILDIHEASHILDVVVSTFNSIPTTNIKYSIDFSSRFNISLGWKYIATDDRRANLIKIWRVSDGQLIHKIIDNYGAGFYFSPDERLFVSRVDKNNINVRQISDGKLIQTMPGESVMGFSADGKLIAVNDRSDLKTKIYEISNGKLIQMINWKNSVQMCTDFGIKLCNIHDRQFYDEYITEWDVDGGKLVRYEDKTIKFLEKSLGTRQELETIRKSIAEGKDSPKARYEASVKMLADITEMSEKFKQHHTPTLSEERKRNGCCVVCGEKLTFGEKLRGKKKCSRHSS